MSLLNINGLQHLTISPTEYPYLITKFLALLNTRIQLVYKQFYMLFKLTISIHYV